MQGPWAGERSFTKHAEGVLRELLEKKHVSGGPVEVLKEELGVWRLSFTEIDLVKQVCAEILNPGDGE